MNPIKAAIFDLDGVITQTATLHAKSWKRMFDAYNENRGKNGEKQFREFSVEDDYPEYLDGMPRYDGVENFLKSRDIQLPRGAEDDDPEKETICGLGNWKNQLFHKILKEEKVDYFEDNVSVIREWKDQGIRIAVISSSKNCKQILEATGLEDLFEVRVDGVVSKERNIKGKPAPDIFLEAARELGVEPSEALIVEDSRAGVKAGKEGGFQRVIGIAGKDQEETMKKHGATEVVQSMKEVKLNEPEESAKQLPSALDKFDEILSAITTHSAVICLDYDGTLSPIVEDYNKAVISDAMRNAVKKVADKIPVAMISGRDITYIQKNVNLDGIYYAGSHGFEIEGPDDFRYELEEAEELLPVFEKLEKSLEQSLQQFSGVRVERKKYAVAVHYRNAEEQQVPDIQSAVDAVLEDYPKLTKGRGKKVIELKPKIEWHKGKAVEMLAKKIGKETEAGAILYIGDDVTDEDAFRIISDGAGILVGSHDEPTAATYSLKDVDEVQEFLEKLADRL